MKKDGKYIKSTFLKTFKFFFVFALFLLLSNIPLSAEYFSLDTLRHQLKYVKGREKVDMLLATAGKLRYYSLKNSVDTLKEAILLCERSGYEKGLADAYALLGDAESQLCRRAIALSYYTKALKIYSKSDNFEDMVKCNIEIGTLYYNIQQFAQTIKYYLKAFDLSKKVRSDLGNGYSNFSIANIYQIINDKNNALLFFQESYNNFMKAGDSVQAAISLMYIGIVYQQLVDNGTNRNKMLSLKYFNDALEFFTNKKDILKLTSLYKFIGTYWYDRKEIEKAVEYWNKSIDYAKQENNYRLLSDCYTLFALLHNRKGEYDRAKEYNELALKYRDSLGSISLVGSSYINLGDTYYLLKDCKSSLEYFFLGLNAARKDNNNIYILKSLKRISIIYDSIGNTPLALDYSRQYSALKDSLSDQELLLDIIGFRLKSDLAKRESEIIELEAKQQKIFLTSLIIGAVVLSLFLVLLVRRNREKSTDNRLLNDQKKMLTNALSELQESREELKILNKQLETKVVEQTGVLHQEMLDKKILQGQLDTTSDLLNKMAVMSPSITYISDSNTHDFIWFNRSWLEMLGYEQKEKDYNHFNANDIARLMPPEDLARIRHREVAFKSNEAEEFEYRLKAADGSWRWFLVRHVPYKIEDDGSVSQVLGLAIDITERRKILDLLEESEKRYRLIAENSNDIIWTADSDFIFTYISPSVSNFLGFEPNELIGKPFYQQAVESDKERIINYINNYQSTIDALESMNQTFSIEMEQFNRIGDLIPSEVMISSLKDARGNTNGVVGITRNITERKKTENKLKQLNEELEKANIAIENALNKEKELNRMKSRFIHMISHEYRTPLTVILSSSEIVRLLISKGTLEKADDYLKKIASSVNLMTHFIDDVIVFTKFEEGNLAINWVIIDLSEFSNKIVDEITLLDKGNHRFIVENRANGVNIMSDYNYLRQIFIHILMNAVKFSSNQTNITLIIEKTDGNRVNIIFQDEGSGFEEKELKDIFIVFNKREQDVGITQGLGLGLAVVKKFIDTLGWTITVESEKNKGSQFIVTVPENYVIS